MKLIAHLQASLWILLFAIPVPMLSGDSETDLHLMSQSHFRIAGKSNVNTFSLSYMELPVGRIGKMESILDRLTTEPLILQIDAFDSGKPRLNRDFRDLMLGEEYPEIRISILDTRGYTDTGRRVHLTAKDLSTIEVLAVFTITEVQQIHEFTVDVNHEDGRIILDSSLDLDIEDYDLEPPTALFGLVQVSPHISIRFNLHLEMV